MVGCLRETFWLIGMIIMGAVGYGMWALTGSLWVAVPVGLVVGFGISFVFGILIGAAAIRRGE